MIASKKIDRLPNSAARLTVTGGAAEGRGEYDGLLRDYAQKVRIDGFRKGKVPVAVLERKFALEMKSEAMGRVLEKAVEEALKEESLVPLAYSTPSLEGDPAFEPGQDFTFSVTYDVFPDVKPGDWKGIEIELPQVSIAKADEERELAEIRERNAVVVDKEAGLKPPRATSSRSTTGSSMPKGRRPRHRTPGFRLRDRDRLQHLQVRRRHHGHEEGRREVPGENLPRGLRA